VVAIDLIAKTAQEISVGDSIVGIAGTSSALFLVDKTNNRIGKVANPATAPSLTAAFITGVNNPTAAVVVGANLDVACDQGLYTSTVASGGVATTLNINGSYASNLSQDNGTLYITRSAPGIVSKVAPATTTVVPVASGLYTLALGAATVGANRYLSTFSGGDAALIELRPDGGTRLLATGLPIDVVPGPNGSLITNDCTGHTISQIDIATGTPTVLLDSGDGVGCPAGMAVDASGTLFYADAVTGKIASLTSANVHTPNFATFSGITPFFLESIGTNLYAAQIAAVPSPIKAYSAAGIESTLVPSAINASESSLHATADGRLLVAHISGLGTVEEADLTTGTLSEVGTTKLDEQTTLGATIVPSVLDTLPDGTVIVQTTYTAGPAVDIRVVAIAP
jgi:hypothetical protein